MQNVTTAIKVGAILTMSVLLLGSGQGLHGVSLSFPAMEVASLTALGAAMIGVLWAL